jgi:hypothetical protein
MVTSNLGTSLNENGNIKTGELNSVELRKPVTFNLT